MKKLTCIICNGVLNESGICPRCGYDHSCDYEQYPTLNRKVPSTVTRAKYRAQYEQAQKQAQAEAAGRNRALRAQSGQALIDVLAAQLNQERKKERAAQLRKALIDVLFAQLRIKLMQEQKNHEEAERRLAQQESEIKKLQNTRSRENTETKRRLAQQESEIKKLQNTRSRQNTEIEALKAQVSRLQEEKRKYIEEIYQTGETAFTDGKYTEAIKWYRRAAEYGSADAQYSLGYCYAQGRGVPRNEVEAFRWYRKSAEQGNVFAQFNLGDYYAQGIGVAKNKAAASSWYQRAAEQGHPQARQALKRLKR